MSRTLIIGGARSGKSAYAKSLAERAAAARIFIATAERTDAEMRERIARHRHERDQSWLTVEEPLELVDAIAAHAERQRSVLVDCLTLWLSNLMHHERDVANATAALVSCLASTDGHIVLVSNEVGLGLVPDTPLGRAFRDAQGRLNQDIAAVCDHVYLVTAGLPVALKP
ncbi:MAG: bifunctional adenosylcobinamide kinase/adenosylcobinamide-phosphate guanylyltransferase [Rhodospirillales bacterium]|nr:bifunctional adenosylcobinamide kinase/adenosylcobinamide-phosphate guanylyltransferase [Rhodospirillales bacterium]